ncbi:MAG: cysteine--tRNA ligase [Clostridiaceae bacterium]|nr:cysteine--tRNA ligase [Clostridiaceae bacterium]
MRIYNTLTREKEELVTIIPGEVRIYVCGPTVYNLIHIGNARPLITFDILRRFLEYSGYKVTFVQNFTDIDDKVIVGAREEGVPIKEFTERYIAAYFADAEALGIRTADIHPRATESIDAILNLIGLLDEKGYTYTLADGVYFDTSKYDKYYQLSKLNPEELSAGESQRVDESIDKRNPADFVLWKFRRGDEPFWPSKWGEGRPGWHIECSAMIHKVLDDQIDIHGGGRDLIFPHHENEIAQSECALGKPFASYWMHNGFVQIDNVKMSKSLGNFVTLRKALQEWGGEVLRFFMLNTHYRSPINYTAAALEAASAGLERLKRAAAALSARVDKPENAAAGTEVSGTEVSDAAANLSAALHTAVAQFDKAMNDDMNTAVALAAIFDLVREINEALTGEIDQSVAAMVLEGLYKLTDCLGLDIRPAAEEIPAEVRRLVEERAVARKARDFARADAIREQVAALGFDIEDTPAGAQIHPRG